MRENSLTLLCCMLGNLPILHYNDHGYPPREHLFFFLLSQSYFWLVTVVFCQDLAKLLQRSRRRKPFFTLTLTAVGSLESFHRYLDKKGRNTCRCGNLMALPFVVPNLA